MNTKHVVSQVVMDGTPDRVYRFLVAVAADREIDRMLSKAGFKEEAVDEAWRLLRACNERPPLVAQADARVFGAIQELDAWDEPNFQRIDAALAHLYPEQRAFVMANLEPTTGADAVVGVETLLDRLDALESAPERKPKRKADRAALAVLGERGYTPAERARLRGLVAVAQKKESTAVTELEHIEQRRAEALVRLRAWWVDWSTTARVVIARRDQRIRLGIASRRRGDPSEPGDGDQPPDAGGSNGTPAAPAPDGSVQTETAHGSAASQ